MRIGIILQSRMDSTRLPNKALKIVSGKTLFERCLEILLSSAGKNFIPILATSERPIDMPLVDMAEAVGVKVFRGSTYDVLKRFYDASNFFELELIARQTGDNPFLSSKLQIQSIEYASTLGDRPFILSSRGSNLPKGLDVEVFNFQALSVANELAGEAYDREHVTPFMLKSDRIINKKIVVANCIFPFASYTIDTQEDLENATKIADSNESLPEMLVSFN